MINIGPIKIEIAGTIEVHHVHSGEVHLIMEQAHYPAVRATLTHGPIRKQTGG